MAETRNSLALRLLLPLGSLAASARRAIRPSGAAAPRVRISSPGIGQPPADLSPPPETPPFESMYKAASIIHGRGRPSASHLNSAWRRLLSPLLPATTGPIQYHQHHPPPQPVQPPRWPSPPPPPPTQRCQWQHLHPHRHPHPHPLGGAWQLLEPPRHLWLHRTAHTTTGVHQPTAGSSAAWGAGQALPDSGPPSSPAAAQPPALLLVHPRHRGAEDREEALRLAESLIGRPCPYLEVGGSRLRPRRQSSLSSRGHVVSGLRSTYFGSGTLLELARRLDGLEAVESGSAPGSGSGSIGTVRQRQHPEDWGLGAAGGVASEEAGAVDGGEHAAGVDRTAAEAGDGVGNGGGGDGGSGGVAALRGTAGGPRAPAFINEVLTPLQERNIESELGRPVVDRVGLILRLFAQRAHTREAKLQVELASLSYMLPRLVRMRGADGRKGAFGVGLGWGGTSSELGPAPQVVSARQRGSTGAGGLGGGGGSGDPELRQQRFRIKQRLATLRSELKALAASRGVQRQGRRAAGLPTVAIVGYTNVGKTSLAGAMCSGDAGLPPPCDMLFATLDPAVRRVWLPTRGSHVAVSDTVGFIRDLPVGLVAAFRATLEEVVAADMLLHVLDASSPNVVQQRDAVLTVLRQLGVSEHALTRRTIEVWNKMDLLAGRCEALHLDNGVIARQSYGAAAATPSSGGASGYAEVSGQGAEAARAASTELWSEDEADDLSDDGWGEGGSADSEDQWDDSGLRDPGTGNGPSAWRRSSSSCGVPAVDLSRGGGGGGAGPGGGTAAPGGRRLREGGGGGDGDGGRGEGGGGGGSWGPEAGVSGGIGREVGGTGSSTTTTTTSSSDAFGGQVPGVAQPAAPPCTPSRRPARRLFAASQTPDVHFPEEAPQPAQATEQDEPSAATQPQPQPQPSPPTLKPGPLTDIRRGLHSAAGAQPRSGSGFSFSPVPGSEAGVGAGIGVGNNSTAQDGLEGGEEEEDGVGRQVEGDGGGGGDGWADTSCLAAAADLVRRVHEASGCVPAAVVLVAVAEGGGVAEVKAAVDAVLRAPPEPPRQHAAGAGPAACSPARGTLPHNHGEAAAAAAAAAAGPAVAGPAGRWVSPLLWLAEGTPWPLPPLPSMRRWPGPAGADDQPPGDRRGRDGGVGAAEWGLHSSEGAANGGGGGSGFTVSHETRLQASSLGQLPSRSLALPLSERVDHDAAVGSKDGSEEPHALSMNAGRLASTPAPTGTHAAAGVMGLPDGEDLEELVRFLRRRRPRGKSGE